MHSIHRPQREGRWLPRLGMFATLPHMKGVEVPSDTPLGQAPMGMEGASCREPPRESCLETDLEGAFVAFCCAA